jgi:F0F1-type ATP synthase membrane subunit b/b'
MKTAILKFIDEAKRNIEESLDFAVENSLSVEQIDKLLDDYNEILKLKSDTIKSLKSGE